MGDSILGMSRISPKHQITIPKDVFVRFKLEVGDRILFREEDGKIILEKG